MSVHVNYDNLLELLAGVAQNLKGKISSIDLTDQQKSQLALIDKILKTGDGTKYLSDNGTYKNIPLDKISPMNDSLRVIYDLLKIQYNNGDIWSTNYANKINITQCFDSVLYNNKIYCAGGYTTAASNILEVYDVISNTWTNTYSKMPTSRYYHKSVLYNGKIYCIGGCNTGANVYDKVEVYDITSNTWSTTYNAMPTARYQFGCIEYNGKIYCIGGCNTLANIYNKVQVYDIASNTWSTNYNNMPTARYSFGCIEYNGKIYCIGGASSTTLNKVEVYDIISNVWSTTYNTMPTIRHSIGCIKYNGKIYCIGGYNGTTTLNKVEVYDIISDIWTANYNIMPTARTAFGSVIYNNKIYCIGGSYIGGSVYDKVEAYQLPYASYNITLPSDISNKLSLLITNGSGNKLLTDNGTYQEYIPSGYRELTTDELNNAINVIKANII